MAAVDPELERLRAPAVDSDGGGPRRPGEPELYGAKEVALECGTQQSNIRTLAGLPEPYGAVAATTLWRADEIRAYATDRRERLKQERRERKRRERKARSG